MSRLRRLVLSDRYFFVTCNLLRGRLFLSENEFSLLARVISWRRKVHGFLLTAWVLLPDHWHAIIYPQHPLTISEAMEAIKVSATRRINRGRQTLGPLFQSRFFDRALRTVKEYGETVEYIHWNPVRRGYVSRPEAWKWSSAKEYAGVDAAEQLPAGGLTIDRVRLPAEARTPI
ncbi:MAG TPA: transposase [Terriglobia bacterium]|nr:transposase [Terriglobia bacterium]